MRTSMIAAVIVGFVVGAGLFLVTVAANPAFSPMGSGMGSGAMGSGMGHGAMGGGMHQGDMGMHGQMHQGDMGPHGAMYGDCHCCDGGSSE